MTCHVALCGIPVPCESLPSIKLDAHGFCDFLKTIGKLNFVVDLIKL